jgi:hypothetical protein
LKIVIKFWKWQGLTNRDIAGVLATSEQVVKNYLRTAFDKLGVWTRLELALYVASHGGATWHLEIGLAPLPARGEWKAPHLEDGSALPEGQAKSASASGGTS